MKHIYTFFIVVFITSSVFSQKRGENKEKIKALKIAYLTEKLDLSSNEAEKFWPIYNKHKNNHSS